MGETIEKRLSDLGVTLPAAAAPAANYVPFVRSGNLLFTAGQLPLKDGKLQAAGLARPRRRHRGGTGRRKALRNQHPGAGEGGARRPRKDRPRGEDHCLRRLDARLHRTASRRQRRVRFSVRSAWRARQACTRRRRHGLAAAQRRRRGRSHHRNRLSVPMKKISWLTKRPIAHRGLHDMNKRSGRTRSRPSGAPSRKTSRSNATCISPPTACRSSSMTAT